MLIRRCAEARGSALREAAVRSRAAGSEAIASEVIAVFHIGTAFSEPMPTKLSSGFEHARASPTGAAAVLDTDAEASRASPVV